MWKVASCSPSPETGSFIGRPLEIHWSWWKSHWT
ncbi:hypothetical protein E2I00_017730 [Balaenoptera physalus]|uniref:Uncharacterized protein n=1 Tax=Balaenoptera physalus TaxID=9770 RepID=A0A643CDK9_BALPH|nr:hypothetical protein E2I00_017730 [Balaenoptera physalus]